MKCTVKIYRWGLLAFLDNASLVINSPSTLSYLCCSFVQKNKQKEKNEAAHTDMLKYYHLHGHSGNVISIFALLPNSVNAHLFDVFRAAAQMPQSKLCRTSSWWLFLRIKGRRRRKKERERRGKKGLAMRYL